MPSDVPLGILPFGGSNVVARELSIPLDPVKAAETASPAAGSGASTWAGPTAATSP